MPSWRHSLRKTAVWSLLVLTLVSSAARYSTGWFAFSYAVWYAT